ncbi:hypothetical protein, partial [Lactobacillus sp. HMSC08B12]|uniref:hypothetical protein n=1 Tax=Lactobacillus sp. HMSC08B12 TaxID=1581136 RepID=UPI001AEF9345
STHPMRDATALGLITNAVAGYFNPRIPCGMRRHKKSMLRQLNYFNPRIPCGMRPQHLVKKAFSQLNIGHTKYKKH